MTNNDNYKTPSRLKTIKYRMNEKWFDFVDKTKYGIVRYLLVPAINKLTSGNSFVKHFENEAKYAGWTAKDYVNELKSVVGLIAIFDRRGHCSHHSATHNIDRVFKFNVLSPLKYTDDEFWNNDSDGTQQNKRKTSIFKYPDGHCEDIDALLYIEKASIDISTEEKDLIEEVNPWGPFHGTVFVYDGNEKTWTPYGNGHKIIKPKRYMGDKSYTIPCITLYDSTDDKNDFFCHIVNKHNIPAEFYEWFELVDVRDKKKMNDGEDWISETIEYLEKNECHHYLYKPVIPAVRYSKVEFFNDKSIHISVANSRVCRELENMLIDRFPNMEDVFINWNLDNDEDVEIIIKNSNNYTEILNDFIRTNNIKKVCNFSIDSDDEEIKSIVNWLIDFDYPEQNIHVSINSNNLAYKLVVE